MATKERYIVDVEGNRVAVVLDAVEYEQLLAELQELREREEMRHYDPAHDPDAGLIVKKELLDELLEEEAEYKSRRSRGKPWDQVKHELGLEQDV